MKIKLTLILLLLFQLTKAQFPVTDVLLNEQIAALTASLSIAQTQEATSQISNFAEYTAQTTALANTLTHLKEVRKALQYVNKQISNVAYYNRIVQMQLEITQRQVEYIRSVNNDKVITLQEAREITNIFTSMLDKSLSLLKFTGDLVTDLNFEMSDGERLKELRAVTNEMSGILSEMITLQYSYEQMSKSKAFYQALENL